MALFVDAFSGERGIVHLSDDARTALRSFSAPSHTDLNIDPDIQQYLLQRVRSSNESILGEDF